MNLVARARKPLSSAFHQLSLRTFHTLQSLAKEKVEAWNPNFIHPTAIVHPDATLGHGVSIGPFCTVGSLVELGNGCKLHPGCHVFGHTQLGDNCILFTGAIVGDDLPGHTVIGSNNIIGHHAVVGAKCQDLKYKDGAECFLDIGDNNEIREHCSIHRSSKEDDRTIIGHNNLVIGSCHIAHDCKIGSNNIFANNTLLAGHIVVEVIITSVESFGLCTHCGCHSRPSALPPWLVRFHLRWLCGILECSFSYMCHCKVCQDVPRFVMVSGDRAELRGLNLEGLRLRGFSVTEIKSLRAAYRKIFMPRLSDSGSIEDRLMELEQHEEVGQLPVVCSMIQSIRDSFCENRRGICKFRQWSAS